MDRGAWWATVHGVAKSGTWLRHLACTPGWLACELTPPQFLSSSNNHGCVECSVMSDSLQSHGLSRQAPLSTGFSRHEYWSRLPFPSPGGSSWPRDQTCISCISCIGRQVLYYSPLGNPQWLWLTHLKLPKSNHTPVWRELVWLFHWPWTQFWPYFFWSSSPGSITIEVHLPRFHYRDLHTHCFPGDFAGGTVVKKLVCQCRRQRRSGFDPWVGKMPWRRKWQSTPVFLPGKTHEQRNLVGYSPWGRKELVTCIFTAKVFIWFLRWMAQCLIGYLLGSWISSFETEFQMELGVCVARSLGGFSLFLKEYPWRGSGIRLECPSLLNIF